MTNLSRYFDSAEDTLTITLTSLADGSGADSSAIDNSTDKFISADLSITTKGTASSSDLLEVYLLASNDNSVFTDSANAKLVGVVQMNGTTAVTDVLRINDLPKYYKIRMVNQSGAALSGTGGDHVIKILGNAFTDA